MRGLGSLAGLSLRLERRRSNPQSDAGTRRAETEQEKEFNAGQFCSKPKTFQLAFDLSLLTGMHPELDVAGALKALNGGSDSLMLASPLSMAKSKKGEKIRATFFFDVHH